MDFFFSWISLIVPALVEDSIEPSKLKLERKPDDSEENVTNYLRCRVEKVVEEERARETV